MNKILVALFFCQFLVGINSLAPISDLEAEQAEQLDGLFDDGGSGGGEGGEGEKEKRAIKNVVDALRNSVIPAVVKATKVKERRNEENAGALVRMLKDNKRRKLVKQKFGKTVLDEHKRCGEIIGDFVHLANKSGLFHALHQLIDDDDMVEQKIVNRIIQAAGEEDGGMMEEILGAIKAEEGLHPAMKAVVVMKKLLLQSTCGSPVEGLIKAAGDSDNPFVALKDRVLPFLGLGDGPSKCRKGLFDKGDKPDNLNEKIARLIFKPQRPCIGVRNVVDTFLSTMTGIGVMTRGNVLKHVYEKRIRAMVGKVVKLMTHGREGYAFELVGDQSLVFLREALLIGLTVHKNLETQKPRPPAPPKVKHDAPLPNMLLRDLELENDLHRMK